MLAAHDMLPAKIGAHGFLVGSPLEARAAARSTSESIMACRRRREQGAASATEGRKASGREKHPASQGTFPTDGGRPPKANRRGRLVSREPPARDGGKAGGSAYLACAECEMLALSQPSQPIATGGRPKAPLPRSHPAPTANFEPAAHASGC